CCDSAVAASEPTAAFLLELLGAAPMPDGLVAITCSPMHRGTCARQAVCCDRNDFDGVIATGCIVRRA
ncbi:hydrophobin, partial [Mycena epipterygia]